MIVQIKDGVDLFPEVPYPRHYYSPLSCVAHSYRGWLVLAPGTRALYWWWNAAEDVVRNVSTREELLQKRLNFASGEWRCETAMLDRLAPVDRAFLSGGSHDCAKH